MKINQLACLLVPALALSLPTSADNWEKTDDDGSSFIFGRGETTTSPGGFSAVAEPANLSGTKSTEKSPPPKHQARSTSTSLTPTAPLQIR